MLKNFSQTLGSFKQLLFLILIFLIPLLILQQATFKYSASLGLLLSIMFLWITEFIPLSITALLIPVVSIFYGLVPAVEAFRPFGHQILFLFIGSFLLAESMHKHGLDKRMSCFVLSRNFASTSLSSMIVVISFMAWGLSMWISNTASCAVLYPICIGLINSLKSRFSSSSEYKNFKLRILFTCAFAASVGGMATPIGSPPNLIALSFLSEIGIDINFLDWMLLGVPLSFIMILLLNSLLAYKFPLGSTDLKHLRVTFSDELKELGKLKEEEIKVGFCFIFAVLFWILPPFLEIIFPDSLTIKELNNKTPMGAVALLAAAILFVLPSENPNVRVLEWVDAKKIDWGTIILFGGGLCLGSILNSSGLASYLGESIFTNQTGENIGLILVIAVGLGIILSELGSNTASAVIVLPLLLATFINMDHSTLSDLILATTFATSFGFVLPVATPPNAIIYGSGEISIKQMIKTGIYFDIIGFSIICVLFYIKIKFF